MYVGLTKNRGNVWKVARKSKKSCNYSLNFYIFTRDLPYIASVLFTHVKYVRDSGNPL